MPDRRASTGCAFSTRQLTYTICRPGAPAELRPDIVTFNTMIDVYGCTGDVEAAYCVLDTMATSGVAATSATYSALMRAAARATFSEVVIDTWQTMVRARVAPDTAALELCLAALVSLVRCHQLPQRRLRMPTWDAACKSSKFAGPLA